MDPITLDAQIAVALEEYNPARAALAELGAEYRKLTTNGREDRAAFNAVVKARRDVKSKRVAVEKTRKALKAGALEYGRAVDGAAKELTAELLAIETHLQAQESLVTDEEKRIEREAEEARQKKVRARMDAFAAVGCQALPLEVEKMTDEEFEAAHDAARAEHEAKKAAEAKAEAEREAEAERLRVEREQIEKDRAEVAAMRAELEAAQKAAFVEKMEEREEPVLPKLIPDPEVMLRKAAEGQMAEQLAEDPTRDIVQPEKLNIPERPAPCADRHPGFFYTVLRWDENMRAHVFSVEDHAGADIAPVRTLHEEGSDIVQEFRIPQEGGAS